jgi:hypothetical protein
MASKGAPKAAAASNSTQLRKAPVSLRSAMRKYAEGGDVEGNNAGVDFARAAQSGAPFGGLMQAIMAAAQQAQQTTTPSDPIPYSPGEGGRGIPTPYPPPEDPGFYQPPVDYIPLPRYLTPPMPQRDEEPSRPIAPDRETPYIAPQQPQGPRTSYRQEADGTLTEIGYDGQPISGYTEQQTAMDRATRGLDPSEYRYVWNGEGYTKVPNGPQIGYNPEENVPPPSREDPQEEPRFYEPEVNYDDRMPVLPPVYDDLMPVPPPEVFPQYPTDPGFYQRPVDYYNPSPPMDFTQDPGFAPTPTPIGIAKSAARGGDLGKLLQDLTSRSKDRTGGDVAKLVAELLARNGGGGSLEEQRRLMELLGSIRG